MSRQWWLLGVLEQRGECKDAEIVQILLGWVVWITKTTCFEGLFQIFAHIFCHWVLCLSENRPPRPLPWEMLLLSVALKAALPPGPACPPLCCQRNPQPLQSNDLQFILLHLEFSLELCCATGSVIPHVFYVSQRGFRVLCWRIKALFGGTCSLTIQLDKLNFPCNLNRLCQNVNCGRLQNYLLTP